MDYLIRCQPLERCSPSVWATSLPHSGHVCSQLYLPSFTHRHTSLPLVIPGALLHGQTQTSSCHLPRPLFQTGVASGLWVLAWSYVQWVFAFLHALYFFRHALPFLRLSLVCLPSAVPLPPQTPPPLQPPLCLFSHPLFSQFTFLYHLDMHCPTVLQALPLPGATCGWTDVTCLHACHLLQGLPYIPVTEGCPSHLCLHGGIFLGVALMCYLLGALLLFVILSGGRSLVSAFCSPSFYLRSLGMPTVETPCWFFCWSCLGDGWRTLMEQVHWPPSDPRRYDPPLPRRRWSYSGAELLQGTWSPRHTATAFPSKRKEPNVFVTCDHENLSASCPCPNLYMPVCDVWNPCRRPSLDYRLPVSTGAWSLASRWRSGIYLDFLQHLLQHLLLPPYYSCLALPDIPGASFAWRPYRLPKTPLGLLWPLLMLCICRQTLLFQSKLPWYYANALLVMLPGNTF